MSESRKRSRHGERGSAAVRVSAACAFGITGAVIGFSMLVGNGTVNDGGITDHRGDVTSRGTGTPDMTATGAAPASSRRVTSEVGDTRHGANTDTTLLQVRKVLAPPGRTAPAGMEWYGIRARTCVDADARASGGVRWSDWAAVTDSTTRYPGRRVAWDDFPPQQYSTDGIDPGTCHVGWVLVAIPRGTFRDVTMVTFRPTSPDPLEWAV